MKNAVQMMFDMLFRKFEYPGITHARVFNAILTEDLHVMNQDKVVIK